MRAFNLFAILSFVLPMAISTAAVPPKALVGEGMQVGGVAGTGFTLLGVQKSKLAGVERLIFDIGDYQGAPLKGWPSYYHVELKDQPRQLVIDLAQTPNSKVDASLLNRVLKDSSLFGTAQVLSDPTEPNLTVIIDLKKSATVKVYQVAGKKSTSKIVIDLVSK